VAGLPTGIALVLARDRSIELGEVVGKEHKSCRTNDPKDLLDSGDLLALASRHETELNA